MTWLWKFYKTTKKQFLVQAQEPGKPSLWMIRKKQKAEQKQQETVKEQQEKRYL